MQIASAYNPFGKTSVDPAYSIVWYNDSKNFVYFGGSTGATLDATAAAWTNDYPTIYTTTGLPLSKPYGNVGVTGANQYVYNAALELNAVAWAIKKAAVSGINSL